MSYPNGPKSLWQDQAREVIELGYPAVANQLQSLIKWLQDPNWPGATEISNFLVEIGKPTIPYIKEILNGNDYFWQYNILNSIVNRWPRNIVIELQDELMKLSRQTNSEGVDISSLYQLAKNNLGETDTINRIIKQRKGSYYSLLEEIAEIENFMKHRS
jgi:hypothetical protein